MSELDKLLEGVASTGSATEKVEWKTLGEVAKIQRGKRLVKNELAEIPGKYAVFQNSMTPLGYYHESNVQSDTTFIISAGAAGEIGYSGVDFWAADDVYYFVTPENLKSKYLYYYLLTQQTKISGQVRRASVPRLSKSAFEKMQIPIPPRSVQKEIVRILDTFTELAAELAPACGELAARRKQYSYYREQLLSFDNCLNHDLLDLHDSKDKVVWKTLGEVAVYSRKRVSSSSIDKSNYVGVDNLLQNRAGKTESNYVPTEGNLTGYSIGDVLIGNIRPYLKKIWYSDRNGGTNGDVLVIHITSGELNPKYLYQVLADDRFFEYNMQHAKGAKMPRGNKDKILEYRFPIPSLEEQARIVSILDKFDTLTTSISEGLPKEIELRKKQYEYYRDKLLTFK